MGVVMKKKPIAILVALLVIGGGAFYFFRPRPVLENPTPISGDLGTRGGATQVNMETH